MSLPRAGRHSSAWWRRWLRGLLIPIIAAGGPEVAVAAGGPSGGVGIPAPSPPKKTQRAGRPTSTHAPSSAGRPTPTRPPAATRRPSPAQSSPLAERGMWIWYVSASSGGNLSSIITTARTYGISTLIIKAGDGRTAWSQFNRQLVAALHAAGIRACAWQYLYGAHPIYEADVGAAAVQAGADCLVIDAESEYQGRYVQAQEYLRQLRRLIGSGYPVALAGFPYIDYHPGFPYSVFLGPGGAQYNVPQMYWPDIGASVDDVYTHTYEFNTLYERPIEPLGELAGNPAPGQVLRFRQLSRAYGATGVSWWDWQESTTRDWQAIDQPVGNLAGFTAAESLPILSLQSQGGIWAGDLVVWAQEHLASAGEQIQIDGAFGPATQAAVEQFQIAHGLPVTGVIDTSTWQALLSRRPLTVTWVTQQGQTIAVASRAGVRLPVPRSAHLRARGYEIPRDLGAGRAPH